jgi:hypothetical protein
MQARCHAIHVISRPNGAAYEPFASTDLQLCAYNLEQSGARARLDSLPIALDPERSRMGARAWSGFALTLPLDSCRLRRGIERQIAVILSHWQEERG